MSKQETLHLAWNLVVELRKEILESQRQRNQMIGFKITFVSTATAVIAANIEKLPIQLLSIPAFASIFFDFLIASLSNSIKRIGFYCDTHLSTIIQQSTDWPNSVLLWEEFLRKYKFGQTYALLGNLGITSISILIAIIGTILSFDWKISIPLIGALLAFFIFDVLAMRKSSQPLKIQTQK